MESQGFVDNGVSLMRVWASDESNKHHRECHFHCHTPLNISAKKNKGVMVAAYCTQMEWIF